jgi:hypothetical protein
MLYYDIPDGRSATFALKTPPGAHDIQQLLPLEPASFSRQVLRWNKKGNYTFQFETLFTM